jgi:hypothetical protein
VDKEQHWRLAYVLPTLQLEFPIEFDGLAFVPNSDRRQKLKRNDAITPPEGGGEEIDNPVFRRFA